MALMLMMRMRMVMVIKGQASAYTEAESKRGPAERTVSGGEVNRVQKGKCMPSSIWSSICGRRQGRRDETGESSGLSKLRLAGCHAVCMYVCV